MMDLAQSEIIQQHPIGTALEPFRDLFQWICEAGNITRDAAALAQLGQEGKKRM